MSALQLSPLLLLMALAAVAALGKAKTGAPCRSYGGGYPRPYPQPPQHEYPFLPAPPGKTPGCARPGATFCETAAHYPAHQIQYLLDRWAFDYSTLLQSEVPDDFNFRYPVTYGPPPNALLAAEANGTAPVAAAEVHGYEPAAEYGPPGYQAGQPDDLQEGYPDRRYPLDAAQTAITYPPPLMTDPSSSAAADSTAEAARWQQQQQQQLQHQRQPVSINLAETANGAWFHRDASSRPRRQAQSAGDTTLCPTAKSYIAPQAALNTQGNWMFVANLPERQGGQRQDQQGSSRYAQYVRSETCISSDCNGLCALPSGFQSRCEQQFVQKTLVALGADGNRLYKDVFWFPHCCLCQISALPPESPPPAG